MEGRGKRVAVPNVQHRDAAGKADEPAPFDVPQFGIVGAVGADAGRTSDAARHGGVTTSRKPDILHQGALHNRN